MTDVEGNDGRSEGKEKMSNHAAYIMKEESESDPVRRKALPCNTKTRREDMTIMMI